MGLSGGSTLPWPSRKKTNVHDNGNWKRKEFEHVFSIKHDNFWIAMFPVFAGLTSQLTSKAE